MHDQFIGPLNFPESTITADICLDVETLLCSSIRRVLAVSCVLARRRPSTLGFDGS